MYDRLLCVFDPVLAALVSWPFFGFKGFCFGFSHPFLDCVLGFSMAGQSPRLFVKKSKKGTGFILGYFLKIARLKNQWLSDLVAFVPVCKFLDHFTCIAFLDSIVFVLGINSSLIAAFRFCF